MKRWVLFLLAVSLADSITLAGAFEHLETWHQNGEEEELAALDATISTSTEYENGTITSVTMTAEIFDPSTDSSTDTPTSVATPTNESPTPGISATTPETIAPSTDSSTDTPTSVATPTNESPTPGISATTPETIAPSTDSSTDTPTSVATPTNESPTLVISTSTPDTTSSTPFITSVMTVSSTTTVTTTTTTTTTTRATPSSSQTSTTRTTPVNCLNGGYYDGVKCVCPDNLFYGPRCEFPLEEIPVKVETVEAKVEVQVKITNGVFSEDLKNPSSEEYINLEVDFKKKMDEVYENVPGYRDVIIQRFRPGSIIVDHDVIIVAEINNNVSAIEQTLQNVTEAVQAQLVIMNSTDQNCTSNSTLCFSAPLDAILNSTTSFNAEDFCRNISDPKFAAYYYPNVTGGTLRCMSRCHQESKQFINCNYGVCRISESGPQCNCNERNTFWYSDSFCQTRIHKGEAGLGIALGIVLLLSAVLAVFLFKAKRKKPEVSSSDVDETWCEDDVPLEWVLPGSVIIKNEAASSYECLERSKGFQPSLESVDTSKKLQFQKPTVVTNPSAHTGSYPDNLCGN